MPDDASVGEAGHGEAAFVAKLLERFEGAWKQGQRPVLSAYVPAEQTQRRAALAALVRVDLQWRLQEGARVRVESYVQRFPDLAQDPQAVAELLAFEHQLRAGRAQRLPEEKPPLGFLPIDSDLGQSAIPCDKSPAKNPSTGSTDRDDPSRDDGAAKTPSPVPSSSAEGVQLRCPHCHNPIRVTDEHPDEILCPGCGSSFRIRDSWVTDTTQGMRPLGKFQLLDRVGVGAFGAVWRARDSELDRIVALKIPHAGLLSSSSELTRFHREARAAAQLRHPGIVTVHEVQMLEGLPTIVADFIEGVTLRSWLESRRPAFREAARLMADVADALEYAHGMGLVHRDLKPANIMIDFGPAKLAATDSDAGKSSGLSDRLGQPLIMDFGLALRDDSEVTMTLDGQIIGTPAYMSPEQAAGLGHQADRRSDIYSLGVILYELLTGELPFRGSREMMLHQVLREEPRPPRALNQKIPRDLETICLKAMSKTPARRYATARDFADDVRRFLRAEPIRARPVHSIERFRRWCARNPALASTTGLAAAALLTATTLSILFAIHQTRATEQLTLETIRAETERTRADTRAREADEARQAAVNERNQAQDAQRRAETERDRSTWMEELLVGRPEDSLTLEGAIIRTPRDIGERLRVVDILQRGQRKSEVRLKDQPDVRATMLDAIGSAYRGLGLYDEAEVRLKESLEIRKTLQGENRNQDLATSHFNLGVLYSHRALLERADFENAQSNFEKALEIRGAKTADDRFFEWKVLFALAWLAIDQEEFGRAHALFQQCVDKRTALPGGDDRDAVRARMGLVYASIEQGGYKTYGASIPKLIEDALRQVVEEEKELKQAVELLRGAVLQVFLADQLPAAGPLNLLSKGMRGQGFADAANKLQRAYDLIESLHPEPHLYKPVVLYFLAGALEKGGDLQAAEAAYGRCLEAARVTVGWDHLKVPFVAANRSRLLIRLGRKEEANRLIEEVMRAQVKRFGPAHYFVANALMTFADLYEELHDYPRQEEAAARALAIYRQTGGPRRRLYKASNDSLSRAVAAKERGKPAERRP